MPKDDMWRVEDRLQKTRWDLMMRPGKGEVEASQLLLSAGYTVYRQYYIAGFFVDIALPDYDLAIEIDHPQKKLNRKQQKRESKIKSEGWRVLRVRNDRVSGIVSVVDEAVHGPRMLKVRR